MVLLLWAELERMEQPNPELTAAVLEICSPERCKLSTRPVPRSTAVWNLKGFAGWGLESLG